MVESASRMLDSSHPNNGTPVIHQPAKKIKNKNKNKNKKVAISILERQVPELYHGSPSNDGAVG